MLLVIGAGLIGGAWCVLLGLIVVSRRAAGPWLADAELAERITVSLIAAFAIGLVCVELHPSGAAAGAPGRLESVMLLVTLGGFATMWAWFRLCATVRSDQTRRAQRLRSSLPYPCDCLAPAARRSRQRAA